MASTQTCENGTGNKQSILIIEFLKNEFSICFYFMEMMD
ncbi:hypothetical protein LEP1GSC111_0299 [Leptospira interrogans str. UT126]|nr:hypothetical protein LEP1GSC111_0299 [Leptospira interrogans str. UT126]